MGTDAVTLIYVATFHTHFSALVSYNALKAAGVQAALKPVPRALSSGCGTCVVYNAESPYLELLDRDMEQVAVKTQDGYRIIHQAT